jgi:hypothetical protein
MATHALIQTLANLKEQIPDEVHRQLGDKVQGVFEEGASRGRDANASIFALTSNPIVKNV